MRTNPDLPPGDYTATFWLTAAPVAIQHGLSVTLSAGETQVTLGQFHFDPVLEYQPYEIAFVHPGGYATLRLEATTSSGFQGMRMTMADDERSALPALPDQRNPLADADFKREAVTAAEIGELIDGVRDVSQLDAFAPRVLCDRIEIRPQRQPDELVRQVEVDKIHYKPGEIVHARVTMEARRPPGPIVIVAEEIRELDEVREVYRESLTLEPGVHERSFAYPLDETEFGRELRCSLWRGDQMEHANSAFFGVSRNVYRIGISGNGGPQDMRGMTREQADALMAANKKAYANYFERFAWAPCDYSNLDPDTEIFFSVKRNIPAPSAALKTSWRRPTLWASRESPTERPARVESRAFEHFSAIRNSSATVPRGPPRNSSTPFIWSVCWPTTICLTRLPAMADGSIGPACEFVSTTNRR